MSSFDPYLANKATAGFNTVFGQSPELVVRCPGRVNLIGEHTDYNNGFVLPIGLPFETVIAASPSLTNEMSIVSESFGSTTFSLDNDPMTTPDWGKFIHGVGSFMFNPESVHMGWNGYICSNIPSGANLSSSAALEVASGFVFKLVGAQETSLQELALIGKRVENELIGVSSGIMDQMACALSQDGSALFLDCLSLETSAVVIPSNAVTVIMDTGTRRELKSSSYNERARNCEQAVASLGVSSLREVSISDLDILRDPLAKRRALHVVSENARVLNVVESFGENDCVTAGSIFNQSHLSLKEDYEVTGPALDRIVEIAVDAPGCFGARMTGGGFAGSAVALVSRDIVRDFCAFVEQNFVCPESQPAVTSTRIYPVEACAGVSIL